MVQQESPIAVAQRLVAELAGQLERLGKAGSATEVAELSGGNSYRDIAKAIYEDRRRRDRFFPVELFGEPGWDILLDLLIAHEEGRSTTVSSCCIASGVPPTTALRWINRFDELGWIERSNDWSDQRRRLVNLTPQAVERMKVWLDEVAQRRVPLAQRSPG